MLIPESHVRIWLYGPPTDMRKSFDGLSALVRTKLDENPLSGQLFVFINRRRTQLKVCTSTAVVIASGPSDWSKASSIHPTRVTNVVSNGPS